MLGNRQGVAGYAFRRPAPERRAFAIVLSDAHAHAEAIAGRLFRHAFENGSQDSPVLRLVFVRRDAYARSANAWANQAKAARLGGGCAPGTDIGPLQNLQLYELATRYFSAQRVRALHFLAGGGVANGPGFFVPPAVVDDPAPDACRLIEEAPCAMVALLKYSDLDEVAAQIDERAPDMMSIWTNDLGRAHRLADRLRSQTVLISEVSPPRLADADPRDDGLLPFLHTRVRVVRPALP